MKCFVTWLNHIMQTHTEANTTSCLLVFVHNRLRSPSRPIYAPCLILPLRCLMSWMPSTTSLTMTLSWEWVSKHTTINTSIHKYLCPTNCTGHHFWSVPVCLEGNASEKKPTMQEARHSESAGLSFIVLVSCGEPDRSPCLITTQPGVHSAILSALCGPPFAKSACLYEATFNSLVRFY